MNRSIIATLLLLSACAGTTPPPAVEIRTVTKTVEVTRPCPVTPPPRPGKLAKPLPTDATKLVAVLALKLLEYDGAGGFADRALAALDTCVKAGAN